MSMDNPFEVDLAGGPELAPDLNAKATDTAPVPHPGGTPPAPMLAGTFAIYEDGQGGYVLVTDTPDHGMMRKHIPAGLVKLATGGGMVSRKLAGIFG